MSEEIVELTVAIIDETSDECLYINGKAWEGKGETTVYATDIDEAADGRLVRFQHLAVKDPGPWPDDLNALEFCG